MGTTTARPPMPPGPIAGPSAWYGRDLGRSDEWIRRLSPAEIDELDAALRHTKRAGLDIIAITRREFPLPTLGPALDLLRGELLRGRGFVLLRGLPMERYGTAEAATLYNHQILHDRTAYEDWPEPERKRHLLRLWLCAPDGRPLPECCLQRYGRITVGDRGGILVRGAIPTVPLEPC